MSKLTCLYIQCDCGEYIYLNASNENFHKKIEIKDNTIWIGAQCRICKATNIAIYPEDHVNKELKKGDSYSGISGDNR